MAFAPGWSSDRALFALLDALDEGAMIFDERLLCRVAGRRAAELLGTDPRELTGISRSELIARVTAASCTPDVLKPLAADPLSIESTVADPIEMLRPQPRTLVWTSVPILRGSTAVGRIDILRDVTREREAEAETAALSRRIIEVSAYDELTGLANKRRFEEECGREHRRSQRSWVAYAVARFDIDGMQAINERHGRAKGDELLKKVGEALRSSRREYDVVGRIRDDEFALLLPGADAQATKKVIRRALLTVCQWGGDLIEGMTASAGAAVWQPPSGATAKDILSRASLALETARAQGPGSLLVDALTFDEWKEELDAAGGTADSGGGSPEG